MAASRGKRAMWRARAVPARGINGILSLDNACTRSSVILPILQRLFLQNHWGLYRSDDGGDSWTDIANGVPSDFGFALEIDHNDPNTAYIIPLESDEFRCTPEAKLRVYKTSNAGDSWTPLTNGLPQENAFETVLRDGMSGDTQKPMGLYFGTRNGKLFGSNDAGIPGSRSKKVCRRLFV